MSRKVAAQLLQRCSMIEVRQADALTALADLRLGVQEQKGPIASVRDGAVHEDFMHSPPAMPKGAESHKNG